jgi:hypothetical protein
LHKPWQKVVCVDNRKLAASLCGLYVHTLGLQPGAKCLPMGRRGHEDDTFPVGNGTCSEATYSPIEKLLILVKLDDVITRSCVGEKAVPGVLRAQIAVRAVARNALHNRSVFGRKA